MSWGGFAGGLAGALQKAEDRYQDKKEREEAREHAKSMQAASLAQAEKMYTIRRKDEWRDKIDATRKELGVYLGGMDDPRANHLMATLLPLGEAGTTVMKNYWDAAQRTGDNVLDLIDLQYKDGVDAENWGSFNIDNLVSDLEHIKFGGDAKYTMKARKPSDLVKSYEFLHMPDEEDFGSSFEAVQTSTSQYMIKNQIRLEKMAKAGKKGSVAYNRIKERIDFAKRVQKQNLLNQAAIDGSSDTLDVTRMTSWQNSFRNGFKSRFESMVHDLGLGEGFGDQFKSEWEGQENKLLAPYQRFLQTELQSLQQFLPENNPTINSRAIYNLGISELQVRVNGWNTLIDNKVKRAQEWMADPNNRTKNLPHNDRIIDFDVELFQAARNYADQKTTSGGPQGIGGANWDAHYQEGLRGIADLLQGGKLVTQGKGKKAKEVWQQPRLKEGTVFHLNGEFHIFKGFNSQIADQTNILGLETYYKLQNPNAIKDLQAGLKYRY